MRIYLDATGGDNAPDSAVLGGVEALRGDLSLTLIMGGEKKRIESLLLNCDDVRGRIEIEDAPEIISNNEPPVLAVRQKKQSPIVRGMLTLKAGECDGFVSAGSTGAVLAGGMFRLGRLEGIERPALAPLLPGKTGNFLLIDCGANVDCKPEWLKQFGVMGGAYMRGVMGVQSPRVGLVNIGAEEEKGNQLTKAAYPLMEKASFNFCGNVEGRDLPMGACDVAVCDGFYGNLLLKFMEGVAGSLMSVIKRELMADARGKLGALIARPAFRRVKKAMDYTEVGGAPLLGVNGAVVKAHGSSNAHAIACAIKQAIKMQNGGVQEKILQECAEQ